MAEIAQISIEGRQADFRERAPLGLGILARTFSGAVEPPSLRAPYTGIVALTLEHFKGGVVYTPSGVEIELTQVTPQVFETDGQFAKSRSARRRARVGAIPWNYDRAELVADGVIHVVGVGLGLGATTTLIVLTGGTTASIHPVIVTGYAVCLLTMLSFSAAYNICPVSPRKWLLRRFDQSAIYLLIAATYTPFITQLKDRDLAASLLVTLWSSAAVGIVLRLLFPGRFDRLSVVLYIAMGWSGIIAYDKAIASLSGSTLTFIATGGILYTLGVIFHLWERLRFQNAIWHLFVLLGAACHFSAVWELALA